MNQNEPRSDQKVAPGAMICRPPPWDGKPTQLRSPVIRYYTQVSAARTFKERGNRAFHQRQWKDAESWYSQALKCGMDEEKGAK